MKTPIPIILLYSLLFLAHTASAQQTGGCGTEISPAGFERYMSYIRKAQSRNSADIAFSLAPINVPVHFYIIRRNDGTGFNGLSQADQLAECDAALDTVNQRFKAANIQFYRCLEPDFILNNMFFDSINVGSAAQQAFTTTNFNPAVVNIYFTSRVLSSTGSNRCGWGRFPTDAERWVIMNYNCLDDRNTFAHELGHYFGLLHTHEDFMGAENVTRDPGNACYDCDADGDFLCDTPADPTLQLNNGTFLVDGSCNYTGTAMDACGVAYTPDTRNVMSYTNGFCGSWFSPGQVGVIQQAYIDTRQAQLDNSVCNQTPCFEDVVLPTNTITASKKVNAQKTITSTEIIMTPPSEDVAYDAGAAIKLLPGFHAKNGARFHAFIDGCFIPDLAPEQVDDRQDFVFFANNDWQQSLQIAPNPTAGETQIRIHLSAHATATVRIHNLQGQLMQRWQIPATDVESTSTLRFDAGQFPPGFYACTLDTEQGHVSRKMVVSR